MCREGVCFKQAFIHVFYYPQRRTQLQNDSFFLFLCGGVVCFFALFYWNRL